MSDEAPADPVTETPPADETPADPVTVDTAEDQPDVDTGDTEPADDTESDTDQDDAETFPAKVVRDLRRENAKVREPAKTAEQRSEELSKRLQEALVRLDGRLQDESDLEHRPALLESAEALSEAITELLERKPHLKAKRIQGDVGQGKRDTAETVDLAAMLRARA